MGNGNTTENVDLVVKKYFENLEKPEGWDKPFPWEPTVSIYFVPADNPNATEAMYRIKEKNFWVWDAIGRKKSANRTFTFTTLSGEKDGKPWTNIVGVVAEILVDGTMKRIIKPAEGTAHNAADPPPVEKKTSTATQKTPPSTDPKPPTNGNGSKGPFDVEKAKKFLDEAALPQSDAWWRLKDQLHLEGAIANSITDLALRAASLEVSKTEYKGYGFFLEMRQDLKEGVEYWTRWLDSYIGEFKFAKLRERYTQLLSVAVSGDHVTMIMNRAWTDLPKSHYDALRVYAVDRTKSLKAGTVQSGGTVQPEVPEPPADAALAETNNQEVTSEEIQF